MYQIISNDLEARAWIVEYNGGTLHYRTFFVSPHTNAGSGTIYKTLDAAIAAIKCDIDNYNKAYAPSTKSTDSKYAAQHRQELAWCSVRHNEAVLHNDMEFSEGILEYMRMVKGMLRREERPDALRD